MLLYHRTRHCWLSERTLYLYLVFCHPPRFEALLRLFPTFFCLQLLQKANGLQCSTYVFHLNRKKMSIPALLTNKWLCITVKVMYLLKTLFTFPKHPVSLPSSWITVLPVVCRGRRTKEIKTVSRPTHYVENFCTLTMFLYSSNNFKYKRK